MCVCVCAYLSRKLISTTLHIFTFRTCIIIATIHVCTCCVCHSCHIMSYHVTSANARVFHRVSSRSAALSQLNFAFAALRCPWMPLDAPGLALKDELFIKLLNNCESHIDASHSRQPLGLKTCICWTPSTQKSQPRSPRSNYSASAFGERLAKTLWPSDLAGEGPKLLRFTYSHLLCLKLDHQSSPMITNDHHTCSIPEPVRPS